MSRNAAAGCNTGGSMRLKPEPRKWSSARTPASRLRASVGGTGRIAFTRYFLEFEASFNKGAAWTQPFSRSKVNRRPGAVTGQPWSDAKGGVPFESISPGSHVSIARVLRLLLLVPAIVLALLAGLGAEETPRQ